MHMKSKAPSRLRPILVLCALLALAGGIVIGMRSAQAGQGPDNVAPGPHPSGAVAHPVPLGIPAIQPRAQLASSTGPHFTADDVRQYIATHRPPDAIPGSPNPTIVSIQFISAADASALMDHEYIGIPDTDLVCFVRLNGDFQGNPPPGVQAGTFHDGVMVFNAYNGNLLVSSVG